MSRKTIQDAVQKLVESKSRTRRLRAGEVRRGRPKEMDVMDWEEGVEEARNSVTYALKYLALPWGDKASVRKALEGLEDAVRILQELFWE